MKQTLALKLRPTTISEIIGQTHLINDNQGIISKMIANDFTPSIIFYGPPGIGKTSLALALASDLKIPYQVFNAALDKKTDLEAILNTAKQADRFLIIVEEIQRMNKDRQDILLQALEQNQLVMFACTTENPFFVINPAVRSRCQIITLEPISTQEMVDGLKKMLKNPKHNLNIKIPLSSLKLVSQIANGDLRIALNILELSINLYPNQQISPEIIRSLAPISNVQGFKGGDQHYDLLSAFQKSIRGSDVDASLHYLARLLASGDYQPLMRRMLVIAYEDIGLASPTLAIKVKNAIDSFTQIGMPEGMIPLGLVVIEMALSEKSHSGYVAIQKAYGDVVKNGASFPIPNHLKDSHYQSAHKLGSGLNYKYPHNFKNHHVKQQYLPTQLLGIKYYNPQSDNLNEQKLNSLYEKFTK